jgi:membrane-associated protease RseP (regulator of RpoE activity)
MNKNFIFIPGLFALGIATGIAMMHGRGKDKTPEPAEQLQTAPFQDTETGNHPMANAFVVTPVSDSDRMQAIEQQLRLLDDRIGELEQVVDDELNESKKSGATAILKPSTVDTPVSSLSPAMTTENLVKAGLDEELAADIIRRRNEMDMKILELRDRASRDGYLDTERYAGELNELRERDIPLRDEIGDEYYDRYLYASRQSNRVRVASVMMGSPAEMSGMKDGDLILNYDDRRIFNWSELQEATSRGERGEYVNVTVLRNGQLLNLWVPRGPLGVRLGTARVKP